MRQELLQLHNITLVFDVGANYGQFAKSLQHAGFKGRIVSFEPLDSVFEVLKKNSTGIHAWQAVKCGLGSTKEIARINVAGNTASSSLLPMSGVHLTAAPESAYSGTQEISIEKLDDLYERFATPADNVYLKIDTQGFEKEVLKGAENVLPLVKGLQLEMSFRELYEGETTFIPMVEYVTSAGFSLCHLSPVLREAASGKLLQADAIFYR